MRVTCAGCQMPLTVDRSMVPVYLASRFQPSGHCHPCPFCGTPIGSSIETERQTLPVRLTVEEARAQMEAQGVDVKAAVIQTLAYVAEARRRQWV